MRNRAEENKIHYNRQRNYCVCLLRKSKRGCYENLNIKNVTDNKLFWKSVKSSLSDKSRIRDRINTSEKGEILKAKSKTAETLISFFSKIVKNLNISRYSKLDLVTENIADPTLSLNTKTAQEYLQYREIVKKKHFVSQRLTLKT